MDHAGLPLKTVLEQLDLLGEEVVPGAAPRVRRPQAGPRPRRPHPSHRWSRRRAGAVSRPTSRRTRRSWEARSLRRTRTAAWRPTRRSPHDEHRRRSPPASRSRRRPASWPTPSARRRPARTLGARARRPTYDVIELRDLAHLITDNALTGFPTGALADAVRRVAEADAVIAVTPVYTGSYSGLFKMFFDVLEDGTLEGKPVLMAATAGTARHSLVLEFAMRPLFAYLRADVVPTAVFAASDDFGVDRLRPRRLALRPHRPRRRRAGRQGPASQHFLERPDSPERPDSLERPASPERPVQESDAVRGPARPAVISRASRAAASDATTSPAGRKAGLAWCSCAAFVPWSPTPTRPGAGVPVGTIDRADRPGLLGSLGCLRTPTRAWDSLIRVAGPWAASSGRAGSPQRSPGTERTGRPCAGRHGPPVAGGGWRSATRRGG